MSEKPPTEVPLCDRCGAIVTLTGYRAKLGDRELLLCPVHAREHDAVLSKQGWAIERLTPPDPVAGPKTFVKCSCGARAAVARTVTASPESIPVQIVHCKACDARTCNTPVNGAKCDSKAMHRDDPICPKGHSLMGGD